MKKVPGRNLSRKKKHNDTLPGDGTLADLGRRQSAQAVRCICQAKVST